MQEMGLLEVKHGLLQIAESLNFLHNNARLIHRAISPEVITYFAFPPPSQPSPCPHLSLLVVLLYEYISFFFTLGILNNKQLLLVQITRSC